MSLNRFLTRTLLLRSVNTKNTIPFVSSFNTIIPSSSIRFYRAKQRRPPNPRKPESETRWIKEEQGPFEKIEIEIEPEYRKYSKRSGAAELFKKYRDEINKRPIHFLVKVLEGNPNLTTAQLYEKAIAQYPDKFRSKVMMKRHLDQLRKCGYVKAQSNPLSKYLPKGQGGFTYKPTIKLQRMLVKQTLKYAVKKEKLLAESKRTTEGTTQQQTGQ